MSYLTQGKIADNTSMNVRVAQAFASEPTAIGDPDWWTSSRKRDWAAAPGWDLAWESALVSHPDDGDPETPPYDPGADEGVITDGQILAQVQAMLAAEASTT